MRGMKFSEIRRNHLSQSSAKSFAQADSRQVSRSKHMSTHSFFNPGTWCGADEEDTSLLTNEPKSNSVNNEDIEELASKLDIDVRGRFGFSYNVYLGSSLCNKCILGHSQACRHLAGSIKVIVQSNTRRINLS